MSRLKGPSDVTAPDTLMVTADIEGVMAPQQASLPNAVAALWEALRTLPMGNHQYEAFGYFFGEGVEQRVRQAFTLDGELQLTLRLEGVIRSVRIVPVDKLARVR